MTFEEQLAHTQAQLARLKDAYACATDCLKFLSNPTFTAAPGYAALCLKRAEELRRGMA